MATSNQKSSAVHPLRYVAGTVVFTLLSAAVIGMLTVAMYGVAVRLGSPVPHLYIASLLGFGLIVSQEAFAEEITGRDDPTPNYDDFHPVMKLAVFVLGIALYNLLMFAALFVILVSLELGVGEVAYLIAFLYPVYDIKTGSKMNPLSVVGLVAWTAQGLYTIGWISRGIAQLVWDIELEPFRLIENLRYRPRG